MSTASSDSAHTPATASTALEARLGALEARVAELESTRGLDGSREGEPATASEGAQATDGGHTRSGERATTGEQATTRGASAPRFSAGGPDDDTFWVLNGLVERLGDGGGVTYAGQVTPPGTDSPVAWQMGLTATGFDEIDFAQAAPALSAFSHPVRLALLQAIHSGATTVAELSADDRFGTTGQIYHHLKALAAAGWLENFPRGHWRVPAQKVIPLLTLILIGTQ
ncbi:MULTISPECIES: winged helix-turn-helix domain-containing protein [unclassified Brevibacterium]|uniref:ArsR/SmtB family transcription factor n=1 Tax=unclassified Brevibacterium TaxID=2614124 RepID=UPI0010F492A0|nr:MULTISPECIES: winged helix-turn-helix domain-containing protein [unclassified Brevibacterium]MCM1010985.1 helix-turn-helix domain-containing protein [Brevibacterium sp. XM4083]